MCTGLLTYDSLAVDAPHQVAISAAAAATAATATKKALLEDLVTLFRFSGVEGTGVGRHDPPAPRARAVEHLVVESSEAVAPHLDVLPIQDGDGVVLVEVLPHAVVGEHVVDLIVVRAMRCGARH